MTEIGRNPRILSIVIPVHNEVTSITPVLANVRHALVHFRQEGLLDGFEIIVIDDGSLDGSVERLALETDIQLLRLPVRSGYGFALKEGFKLAKGGRIGFLDMDETYDPMDLGKLFREMNARNADMATGMRLSKSSRMPWIRALGNRIFVGLTRLFFDVGVRDVATGFRIFDFGMLDDVLCLPKNDLSFSFALTLHSLDQGFKTVEVPISYGIRNGESKLSVVRDGFSFLFLVCSFYFRKRFPARQVPARGSDC
jgi:glycosyltransferase involved in cell wall biosynthesis